MGSGLCPPDEIVALLLLALRGTKDYRLFGKTCQWKDILNIDCNIFLIPELLFPDQIWCGVLDIICFWRKFNSKLLRCESFGESCIVRSYKKSVFYESKTETDQNLKYIIQIPNNWKYRIWNCLSSFESYENILTQMPTIIQFYFLLSKAQKWESKHGALILKSNMR